MPIKIYALTDPRNGEIRYVGQTQLPIDQRIANAARYAKRRPRHPYHQWLLELMAEGLRPTWSILQIVNGCRYPSYEIEGDWIEKLYNQGCRLTNMAIPYRVVLKNGREIRRWMNVGRRWNGKNYAIKQ